MIEESQELEPVLVVPPHLTQSSYATLLALDCVPRKWHPEGRFGSRTHKIIEKQKEMCIIDSDANTCGGKKKGKIGIPLLRSKEKIELIKSYLCFRDDGDGAGEGGNIGTGKGDNRLTDENDTSTNPHIRELHELMLTPGVNLIYETPVLSNKIPKDETVDATIHSNRMPEGFLLKLKGFLAADTRGDKVDDNEEGQVNATNTHSDSRPPRKRKKLSSGTKTSSSSCKFTFCELFAGIGGFGMALEALGGKCVFASEIYEPSKQVYEDNLNLDCGVDVDVDDENETQRSSHATMPISGDIWDVQSEDIPFHDILVGGFPCQPFSSLGDQPGLQDSKCISGRSLGTQTQEDVTHNQNQKKGGRGQLFTQIVRILRDVQPNAFLLENVPGLITTDGGKALKTIVSSLEGAGYSVSFEVCSSRGLTAQSRKRLYFVGLHNKYCADAVLDTDLSNQSMDGNKFQFPFMPDLQLRAGDILHTEEELQFSFSAAGIPDNLVRHCGFELENHTPASVLRITDAQMDQLRHRSKSWKPAKLAWNNTSCDTIDSHYGVSVGKGHSQLVPSPAPHHPRRFSPRECARAMGFSNNFLLGKCAKKRIKRENKYGTIAAFNGHIKEQYYMLGNAVCPPVIAVLAGAILSHIRSAQRQSECSDDWIDKGLWAGVELAYDALAPSSRKRSCARLSRKINLDLCIH